MLHIPETLKKVRTNNLKIKNNEKRLWTELELIKTQNKDRKKFDKLVKESKSAIANIRFCMTYIQNANLTNVEDYVQIIQDLEDDEKRLNNICEELANFLESEA